MKHRHTQAKRNSRSILCLTVLTTFALLMWSIQAVEAQGTETFRLEGTVREVTDEPVGEGFAVEAINQRVPTGWLLELSTNTLDDGTYTIIFFDPFGGLTTNVGDELQITVTDANGNVVGRKTYVVTQAAVDAQRATNVDVILLEPPIVTAISPAFGPASGETIVTITGENFVEGVTVAIGGNVPTDATFISATEVTAQTPPGTVGIVDVIITNPDGQSGQLTGGFTYIAPPTIASISPNQGSVEGGTVLTITGENFVEGVTVTIGGNTATNVTFISATEVTAQTPAGPAGIVDVIVTNPDGQSGQLTGGFTYIAPPSITSISPNQGSVEGGTVITVTGENFVDNATITIGSAPATDVRVISAIEVIGTTPAGRAGSVDVVVINPDGQSDTLDAGFTYIPIPPTLAQLQPNTGPTSGGTQVTITGTNFTNGATVTVGDTTATNVTVVSPTQITVTTPAGIAGSADVTVTNPDGGSAISRAGFTYIAPPTVVSISPTFGPVIGGTAITITGQNFVEGATVTFGERAAISVTAISRTEITATTPPGPSGVADVMVTNPDGQSSSIPVGFTYIGPPIATEISPVAGHAAGGTLIAITGENFLEGAIVRIGGTVATDVTVDSLVQITATTPAGNAGAVDVVVVNPDGQEATLTDGFSYLLSPELTTISPVSGSVGGGTAITIRGTGFVDGLKVTFGGVDATRVAVVSVTEITAITPAGNAGAVDVVIVNPDGQAGTQPGGFTYISPPSVTSITPTSGPTTGGTTIAIAGTDFVDGAQVTIGGVVATGITVISATEIAVTTPAASAGVADVVVTNPDGQSSTLPVAFTFVGSLTITDISASLGPVAGGTPITITGENFLEGITVTVGGIPATDVTVISKTEIVAKTPAASAGIVDIIVTNPDGQSATVRGGFTYIPPPTLTDISPVIASVVGGTTVTIMGENFRDGVTITIGGDAATDVTFVSSTEITAKTPPGNGGSVDVTVTNPDGQAFTLAAGLIYARPPSVRRIFPIGGPVAGGTPITITGENFLEGATVSLDGTPAIDVQVVSDTEILATTPPSSAGLANVVVTNPDGVSATAESGFLYIAPPVIAQLSVTGGPVIGGTPITIIGRNFLEGATVTFGGNPATDVTVVSDTEMTAKTPQGTSGAVNVVVTNLDGQSATVTNGFIYILPPSPGESLQIEVPLTAPDGTPLGMLQLDIPSENLTVGEVPSVSIRVEGIEALAAQGFDTTRTFGGFAIDIDIRDAAGNSITVFNPPLTLDFPIDSGLSPRPDVILISSDSGFRPVPTVFIPGPPPALRGTINHLSFVTTGLNTAPLGNPQDVSVDEDGSVEITLSGSDTDGDLLEYSIVSLPTNGSLSDGGNRISSAPFSGSNMVIYTPNPNYFGDDRFEFNVNDGATDSDEVATVTITVNPVNDAPDAAEDTYDLNEDEVFTIPSIDGVLTNDIDMDSESITATLVTDVSNGTLALAENGSFTYTPTADFFGVDTFSYAAKDSGDAISTTVTVTLSVNAVNDRPTIDAIAELEPILDTDGEQTIELSGITAGGLNESQTLIVTAVSNNTTIIPSPVVEYTSPGETGILRFSPVPRSLNAPEVTVEITVTVQDDGSGEDTTSATFNIRVIRSSQELIAVSQTVTTSEDTPVIVTLDATTEDSEAVLRAVITTLPTNGKLYQTDDGITRSEEITLAELPVTNSERYVIYVPSENGHGETFDSFGFIVTDLRDNSAEAFVTLNVSPVNDSPTIDRPQDTLRIDEDASEQTITLLGIGTGASNEAQTLTIEAFSSNPALIPNPAVIYTSPQPTGILTFTPVRDANGTVTITATVRDDGGTDNGGIDAISVLFTVAIDPVNDAPTISQIPDQIVDEDTPTAAIAFTVGDRDTAVTALTLSGSSSNPTLIPNADIVFDGTGANRTVQLTPATNQSGVATITATVSDGTDTTRTTFSLIVTGVNDAPTISDISDQTTDQDTPTQAIGFIIGDAETNPSNLTVTGNSSNPTLVPNADIVFGGTGANRTVRITPAANQSGDATITVTVSDGTETVSDTFVLTVIDRILEIANTSPQDATIHIPVNGDIQIDFGEPLDTATVTLDAILVEGARTHTGDVVFENDRLIFRPDQPLGDEESIQVTVKTTVQDTAGNALERDFTFSFTTGFGVWPGDTNNDGRVNLLDIIPIARHWNQPGGIPRETPQAFEWAVQPVAPWLVKPATYVDANGDGLINEDDIIPIAENWLESRNLSPPAAPEEPAVADTIDLQLYQQMLNALDRYGVVTKGTLALRGWLTQRIATLRKQRIPDQTKLLPNYPNPFNPETWIPYQLAETTRVQIAIYDLKGKRVRMLDVGDKPAGYYVQRNKAAYWDGTNHLGEPIASGIYIYHLVAGDYTQTRRMVIVK